MREYYKHIASKKLLEIFDEQDVETVLTWLTSNDGHRPVVVVGAGFSLNAINKRSMAPVTGAEVPLWADVLHRFSTDLRLAQNGYDALTFAELYYEEMKPAKFNITLLDMVKDDDLAPAEAHAALFAYPKEAVVTTNQLDTLLDKNGRGWKCVVSDPDLALGRANDAAIDLIYFHGHRHNRASWVFTRSQYEDIDKTRPLVVTKVRQLLSQHPVLIVGYSLSDPDFHHIYRQISLDMAYHHPLGLALFPHNMGPKTAERRHWDKLGIRIATFKNAKHAFSTSECFKRFFEINPVPDMPLDNIDSVKEWIRDGSDFKSRCRRAEDFLSHQGRSTIVETDKYSEYGVWIEPIKCEFTEDEWKQVNFIHIDDRQYDETMTPAKKPTALRLESRSTFRGFKVLDRKRFRSHAALSRRIDAFLDRRRDLRLDLARWLTFAFAEDRVSEDKSLILDLLSWIWRNVVENPVDRYDARAEAQDVMRRCLAIAFKNNYEREREHVKEDALTIKLDVSGVVPAGERSPEFLQKMKDGFEGMLDGAFLDARKAYEQAWIIAKQHGDAFGEWVASHGEEDAVWASFDPMERAKKGSKSQTDDYRRRRLAMEQAPKVKEWMEQTRQLREHVIQRVVEAFIRHERQQTIGERSMSFSKYPYDYWTMFRDLEIIHAPSNLQQRYVQPLIDLGEFDPGEELRYRLQLGVDGTEKTEAWISRITDDRRTSLEEQRKRHDALLKEFTRTNAFKIERVRRIEILHEIAHIFRVEDLDWALLFLQRYQESMKGDRWNNPYAYVRALCGYAGLETRSIAIDRLEQYVSGAPSRRDRDELARALRNRLPLEQWVGLHTDAAERLVRLVLNLDRSSDGQEVSHSDEDLAWAIFSVIRSANRFGRPLTVAMLEEARAWGDRLLQKKLPGEHFYLQSTFNAATHLTYLLALDDGARDDVVRKALAGGLRTAEDAPSQGSMGVWISLVEAGVSPTGAAMTEAADRLLINLDETWESLLTFAKNNPHYAWPPVAFLAQAIILGLTKDLSLARERLLQLVQAAPDHLSLCAGLLDARFWGDQWQPFLDHVWKLSGGGDGPDPVAARTGAVDLLGQWVNRSPAASGELPAELGFLVDATLLAVLDQSPIVANHAAYNIVGYAARARSPIEVRRIVGALRRMAIDPRLGVRGAAAYAGTKLPLMNVADEIRTIALEIDKALAEDTYAVIQRQRRFGELDGKYPPT